jgi:hypothetical protein
LSETARHLIGDALRIGVVELVEDLVDRDALDEAPRIVADVVVALGAPVARSLSQRIENDDGLTVTTAPRVRLKERPT